MKESVKYKGKIYDVRYVYASIIAGRQVLRVVLEVEHCPPVVGASLASGGDEINYSEVADQLPGYEIQKGSEIR